MAQSDNQNGEQVPERVPGDDTGEPTAAKVVRRRRSMWDDRRVRTMAIGAGMVVALYLLTVISALVLGILGGTDAPETAVEREIMAAESALRSVEASQTSADTWQSYVVALVNADQLQRAENTIEEVNSTPQIDQTRGANMTFATGVLEEWRDNDEAALEAYVETMELTEAAYEKELARGQGDGQPNWALSDGIHDNYYASAVRRAAIYQDQGRLDEALEMLDLYLEENPYEAGILVDRASLKVEMDDLEGAEADYRRALDFVPDFTEALEGLEQIGAGE